MSKKEIWGTGYIVCAELLNRMNGRLYETIEAVGLPEKQEASLKSLIRKATWDAFHLDAEFLSDKDHTELRERFIKNPSQEFCNEE